MTQKKFFTAAFILAILMAGFFYFKLQSKQAQWCDPYFNFECDAKAQLECLGGDYTTDSIGGFCRNSTCVSTYRLYCQIDDVVWEFKTDIDCESLNHPQCGGQW